MKKTIQTIKSLRLKGAPISHNVINTIAKRIAVINDKTMLVVHGGHLTFKVNWAQKNLNEITRSKRKMVRREAMTSKIPIASRFLKEE